MKNLRTKIFFGIFLAGLIVALYPLLSNTLAELEHTSVISQYQEIVNEISSDQLEKEWQKAVEYNESLAGDVIEDPFIPGSGVVKPDNYEEILNVNGDGVVGYIEIPDINVYLPIYHGVTEEVLQKGVGHMVNTAFPIGGKKTHAVLAAHRGLSSAKLFTDLDKVEVKDYFKLYVLNRELTCQVDKIIVIEPEDTSLLQPVEGKEYITLLTCTPYGVNSHRLLVRGIKVGEKLIEDTKTQNASETNSIANRFPYLNYWILVVLLLSVLLIFVIWRKIKRKK